MVSLAALLKTSSGIYVFCQAIILARGEWQLLSKEHFYPDECCWTHTHTH